MHVFYRSMDTEKKQKTSVGTCIPRGNNRSYSFTCSFNASPLLTSQRGWCACFAEALRIVTSVSPSGQWSASALPPWSL